MFPPGAVRPDYAGYCLSNLPSTILSIFGINQSRHVLPKDALGNVETSDVDNVILLLCDGFGYNEWRRQTGKGFVGAISSKGSVKPITTIFPSTTAAALTTVCTGLTPQEHGLPEWFVYMDELGEVIATLPFSKAGERRRDTLKDTLPPRALFDGNTIFHELHDEGVNCVSLTNRNLAFSAYSTVSRGGSDVVPYGAASELTVSLRRLVERSGGQNFYYAYWSYVDTIEHLHGPGTDEAEVEASMISHAFQEGFLSKLDRGAAKRTLVLVTADHGQLQVNPAETVYMNRYQKLVRALQRTPSGGMIPPWGSPRDVYLRVDDEKVEDARMYLERKLGDVAAVMPTREAIDAGLFGINKPSRKFLRRVGNLMILPYGNNLVWFRYENADPFDLRGHHGGLTNDEMMIPLAAARVSDIQ